MADIFLITARQDTWLKKTTGQADDLSDDQKVFIGKDESKGVITWGANIPDIPPAGDQQSEEEKETGHELIKLAAGAGVWNIYVEHWQGFPWHKVSKNTPETKFQVPEWNEVNWRDWDAPVSKYFTVGEVTNMSRERIPTATDIKKNIIAIARHMDDIREDWGGPLGVNSFYRPWHVNTRIGSRSSNHPSGTAVDFRPLDGRTVWELQKWFDKNWYQTGRWGGGFGLGANRGFVHLDINPQFGKRAWNY